MAYMKRLLSFFFLFITVVWVNAQMPFGLPPKREVRAVWLTTIGGLDWPHSYARTSQGIEKQKKELEEILDNLQESNINTVLMQVRIRATTAFPSSMEPWDGAFSGIPGRSPGYNPLAFAISECHKRGMELHAWVVVIPAGKWNGIGARTLRANGLPVKRIGNDAFLDPERPISASYIGTFCKQIARDYDVDGIHLDYIRYPEQWRLRVSHEQARANITRIVRTVYREVKAVKPWIRVSCAPIGKYSDLSRYSSYGWNAYTKGNQPAQQWLEEGIMDQVYPMMYFQGNQFYPFAADWQENSFGRTVVPGLGAYFLDPSLGSWQLGDITRQLYVLRQLNMGHAYFRSSFFTHNVKGLRLYANDFVDAYPALTPALTWQSTEPPHSPAWTEKPREVNGNRIMMSWKGTTPYYNIYVSCSSPVDIADARNLVAVRYTRNELILQDKGQPIYVAVTGMDRYGNESKALQSMDYVPSQEGPTVPLLLCKANELKVPQCVSEGDFKYFQLRNVVGGVVRSYIKPSKGYISLAYVPYGAYWLYGLSKKGWHRLGVFYYKKTL